VRRKATAMQYVAIVVVFFLVVLLGGYELARCIDRVRLRAIRNRLLSSRTDQQDAMASVRALLVVVGEFLGCAPERLRRGDVFSKELRIQSRVFDWIEGSAWRDFEGFLVSHHFDSLAKNFSEDLSIGELTGVDSSRMVAAAPIKEREI
jgi:hypothetical protein